MLQSQHICQLKFIIVPLCFFIFQSLCNDSGIKDDAISVIDTDEVRNCFLYYLFHDIGYKLLFIESQYYSIEEFDLTIH